MLDPRCMTSPTLLNMTSSSLLSLEGAPLRDRTVDVEVVIPVFNEEADLEASVRRLHR